MKTENIAFPYYQGAQKGGKLSLNSDRKLSLNNIHHMFGNACEGDGNSIIVSLKNLLFNFKKKINIFIFIIKVVRLDFIFFTTIPKYVSYNERQLIRILH